MKPVMDRLMAKVKLTHRVTYEATVGPSVQDQNAFKLLERGG